MEEKIYFGRIVGRYLEITEIENYLQSINKSATLSTNPYITPGEEEINKWSLAFFDFMTSEEEMESLINSLRSMGLSVKGNISNLPLKTVEEIYAYCKPITVITSWTELHKLYKQAVATWNEETFRTFENWLQENCEVPQLLKKN